VKLRNARLVRPVLESRISPSTFIPGNNCGLAVKFPNHTSVRSGSVSQYIPPLTLSSSGKSRLVRSGRLESVKLCVIWDKAGAVIFCNPAEDEVPKFPSIIEMPLSVTCAKESLWMARFPVIVLQLFKVSASAWEAIVKVPPAPVGAVQSTSATSHLLVSL